MMKIKRVELSAKSHPHYQKAVLQRLTRLQEHPTKHLEVRDADSRVTALLQYTVEFRQGVRKRFKEAEMLQHVRGVNLINGIGFELTQIAAIPNEIDRRPIVDIENVPARNPFRPPAPDMQTHGYGVTPAARPSRAASSSRQRPTISM